MKNVDWILFASITIRDSLNQESEGVFTYEDLEKLGRPLDVMVELKRLLVAVDGSKNSRRAVVVAVKLAKLYGAEIFVVHVISLPLQQQQFSQYVRAGAEKLVGNVASMCKSKGLKASPEILEGSSMVGAIVNYAADNKINLIVIGTRGLSSFRKLLLGSVSSGVLNHAHCSVLVVR